LFAVDDNRHIPDSPAPEYGNIPYITGHSQQNDASLLWVNAADTWVDILPTKDGQSMFSNFVSESGQIELFIFSSDSPKKQLFSLAKISGHAPMPPIETLGFHFSKWAEVSADIIIERNNQFNDNAFPVDVFWIDIEYTRDRAYFSFD